MLDKEEALRELQAVGRFSIDMKSVIFPIPRPYLVWHRSLSSVAGALAPERTLPSATVGATSTVATSHSYDRPELDAYG